MFVVIRLWQCIVFVFQRMLTLTLGLPTDAMGNTVGLTGVYDDDTENDLTYLNGTAHISTNSSESEIFEWAETCEWYINCLRNVCGIGYNNPHGVVFFLSNGYEN